MERNWILFMFFAFIVVSAGFLSIQQVKDEEEARIGGNTLEEIDISECSEAEKVAAERVKVVYSCDSRSLADFTVVDIGSEPANDCPSGCFPSYYRFVVQDGQASFIGAKYGALASMVEGVDEIDNTGYVLANLNELQENASISDLKRPVS